MEQLNQIVNQYKYPLVLSFIGLVLIVGGLVSQGLLASKSTKTYPKESIVSKNSSPSSVFLKVDISGAVNNPGVYEFLTDDRVEQAITKAGGFSQDANPDFIAKSLNLSQKLADGQKIYVPFKGENSGGIVAGATLGVQPLSGVSINNASQKELEDLPSVGAVTASKIITNRPYSSLEDLVTKKVITRSVFNKIKDLIQI